MQPAWDALRQRGALAGCAPSGKMQPAWDALRQSVVCYWREVSAYDATRMGCAEDWSVSRAYISHESIAATLTTVA